MTDDALVKRIFEAFDPEKTGTIDLFFLGEIIYAYGISTNNDICFRLGQVKTEGKSFAEFDAVLEKVNAVKKTTDEILESEFYSFSEFI